MVAISTARNGGTVIREVIVRGRAEGVQQTTAALKGQESALNALTAAAAGWDRSQLSAGSKLDQTLTRIDATYAATKKYEREVANLAAAQRQGLITQEDVTAKLELAQQKYFGAASAAAQFARANDNAAAGWQRLSAAGAANLQSIDQMNRFAAANDAAAAKLAAMGGAGAKAAAGTKLASHEMANLSAQFTDVAVGLATGQSLFMVAAQQGPQISAALGDRGAKGAVAALGQALLGFATNPLMLATAGIAALGAGIAAVAGSGESEIDKLNRALQTHDDILKKINDRYGSAISNVRTYAGQSSTLLQAAATANLRSLQAQSISQGQDVLQQFGGEPRRGRYVADAQYAALNDALLKFRDTVKANKPDFETLQSFVDEMYLARPGDSAIAKIYKDVSAATAKGLQLQGMLPSARAATADPAELRRRQLDETTRPWVDEYVAGRERAAEAERRAAEASSFALREIGARTVAERAALAADKARAEALRDTTTARYADAAAARASSEVYAQAKREQDDFERSRSMNLQQGLAARQLDVQMIGATTAATEAARFKLQQYQDIEREALTRGGEWAARARSEVDQLAASYGALAEQASQRKLITDLQFDTAQMARGAREVAINERLGARLEDCA